MRYTNKSVSINTASIDYARKQLSFFVQKKALQMKKQLGFGYIDCPNAPGDYNALLQAFKCSKLNACALPVFSGACENTIYINPEHNLQFRFWHDCCHAIYEQDFSYTGETYIAKLHLTDVELQFGADSIEHKLMHWDTIGQLNYFTQNNEFPLNQLEFVKSKILENAKG